MNEDKTSSKFETILKNTLAIISCILSILTLCISFWTFQNTSYYKDIELDKEDNMYISRYQKSTDNDKFNYFIYSLCSSEDISNYSNVEIQPLLHIYMKNDNEEIVDSIFIELPELYTLCTLDNKSAIVSFTDFIETENFNDASFRVETKQYNDESNEIYMDSDIIYRITYKYISKRNIAQPKEVYISRNYDFFNNLEKSNLYVDDKIANEYDNANQKNQIYTLKTLKKFYRLGVNSIKNCTTSLEDMLIEDMRKECSEYMDDFQSKYGLNDFIEQQNELTQ